MLQTQQILIMLWGIHGLETESQLNESDILGLQVQSSGRQSNSGQQTISQWDTV